MKKILNWMLAAIFICGSSVFASCVANEDNSSADVPGGEVTEPYVEPTDDQLEVKVTADMPTAVLAQFDESTVAAALIKRLPQTTTAINDDTKLVLLDDSQIKSLTEDDYFAMSRVIFNGGYVALHRPKFENAFFFAVSLDDQFEKIQNAILKENGVEGADDEPAASSSSDGGDMVRKVNNVRALHRSGEAIDENTVIDELMVFSINANYLIPPYSEELPAASKTEDEQGQETTVETKEKFLLNPYHCGHLADGVAAWLNTKEQEKAEAQQPEAASAKRRAEANEVINSMLSCTDEFTISGSLRAFDDQGRRYNRKNASNTTIRSWSIHDFGSNRDFYYVEENHHIRMGGENSDKSKTLYWGPYDKEKWMYTWEKWHPFGDMYVDAPKKFSVEGYEDQGSIYAFYYGSWLDESSHAMNLSGAGEINVEKSLPSTDNNQTTETIAIGTTDGTSHTSGWSFGGSLGGNAGMSGSNGTGGGSGGFNFSYSKSTTTIHNTSFTMSTSSVSKDLAIKRNTDGAKVTWTYEAGHTPRVIWDKMWHEMAAPILTNDIDITNKVCWSVKNPSGKYQLAWYKQNWTKAVFVQWGKSTAQRFALNSACSKTYNLTPPRRFKKEWYCDLRVLGKNLKDDATEKFLAYLREVVNPTMFSNKFNLAEATNDDVKVIKYNVGVATKILKKNSQLRDMIEYRAKELGIEKYTIKWFTNDEAVNKKHKPFTFPREIGKN
ncbi:MAG: hypothetical protein J6E43_04275 [Prevotella sp.]|nr:hypothetical protein [Prevotella sp.]